MMTFSIVGVVIIVGVIAVIVLNIEFWNFVGKSWLLADFWSKLINGST